MANQIIIIGFMGTGKSTVARELARRLDCLAVDLDELINSKEARRPGEIIEQDGEEKFREIETEMLGEVLLAGAARVVAVGGGAWTVPRNRKSIADHAAFTVWLDAPFELCWRRIESGQLARPLARSRELAEKLYRERRSSYELADARVRIADHDSAEDIAKRIVHELSQPHANSAESQTPDD